MVLIYILFEIVATFVESYFSFSFNDLFVTQEMPKKKVCDYVSYIDCNHIFNKFYESFLNTYAIGCAFICIYNKSLSFWNTVI